MFERPPVTPRQPRPLDRTTVDRWQVAGGVAGVASVVISLVGTATAQFPMSVVAGLGLMVIGVVLLYRWGRDLRRVSTVKMFVLPVAVTITGAMLAAVGTALTLVPSPNVSAEEQIGDSLVPPSQTATVPPTAPSDPAGKAPSTGSTARFCNHNIDIGVSECFDSRSAQLSNGRSAGLSLILSAYNWIDYNPGGGVVDYYAAAQCTVTVSDIDYPSSASDPTGRNLQVSFYGNDISLNNTISSVSTPSGGCDIKLWDYNNYGSGGDNSQWIHSCSHLGEPSRQGCPSGNWYDRAGSFTLS